MSASPGRVLVEDDGLVRTLTLVNPAKRNALDEGMLRELRAQLAAPPGAARALLIRGDEKAFCSGFDLAGLDASKLGGDLPDALVTLVMDAVQAHPLPSVALVSGPAFGAGCELAVACDFRVAAKGAVFSLPPAKVGVVYSPRGIARVSALVGEGFSRRMFLTARRVTAEEALAKGLADELAPDFAQAETAARALLDELCAMAPLSLSGMRKIFLAQREHAPDLDERFRALRREAFDSEDAKEGRRAILEKRPARFTGR